MDRLNIFSRIELGPESSNVRIIEQMYNNSRYYIAEIKISPNLSNPEAKIVRQLLMESIIYLLTNDLRDTIVQRSGAPIVRERVSDTESSVSNISINKNLETVYANHEEVVMNIGYRYTKEEYITCRPECLSDHVRIVTLRIGCGIDNNYNFEYKNSSQSLNTYALEKLIYAVFYYRMLEDMSVYGGTIPIILDNREKQLHLLEGLIASAILSSNIFNYYPQVTEVYTKLSTLYQVKGDGKFMIYAYSLYKDDINYESHNHIINCDRHYPKLHKLTYIE